MFPVINESYAFGSQYSFFEHTELNINLYFKAICANSRVLSIFIKLIYVFIP